MDTLQSNYMDSPSQLQSEHQYSNNQTDPFRQLQAELEAGKVMDSTDSVAENGGRAAVDADAVNRKTLLSVTGLTNTHSATDKDVSGGEEETTSRRRRRSRWDPPPSEQLEDGSAGSGGTGDGNAGTGGRKRKSRWADDEPKPVVQLPDFMKDFAGGIEFDPEIQALNSRLLEISRKLQSGLPLDDWPEGARSPSPEPVYDNFGVRINTREFRAREKLNRERQEIISLIIKKNPAFKPPADYRPPKFQKKLYIPMKEYPGYNFIGLIIGPRGNTQKRMERETGAKIVIRGKGSVKEGRLQQKRDLKHDLAENEDLHVLVEADTEEALEAAAGMVEKLLQPVDEVLNEHKRQQLRELAALNGTIRDEEFCRLCGEPGHRQYACPSRLTTFKSDVLCKICGDGGHPTVDCPVKNTTGKKMDDEYQNFLSELGGTVPSSSTEQKSSTLALGSSATAPWSGGTNTSTQAGVGANPLKPQEYDETNLYIGYLPPNLDDDGLIGLFSPFGDIVMAKVIKDRASGLSKGYGFVKYSDVQQANNAIASMNGHKLEGRTIAVRVAGKPPQPPAPPVPPAASLAPYPSLNHPFNAYPSQQYNASGMIGSAPPPGGYVGAPVPWAAPVLPPSYAAYPPPPPPPGSETYTSVPGQQVSQPGLQYPSIPLPPGSSTVPMHNISSTDTPISYASSGEAPKVYSSEAPPSNSPPVPAYGYTGSAAPVPPGAHFSYPTPTYGYAPYYPAVPAPPPPSVLHLQLDPSQCLNNAPWASNQSVPPTSSTEKSSYRADSEYEKFMSETK